VQRQLQSGPHLQLPTADRLVSVFQKALVETQNLINLSLAGAASVLGWFARELWSAVKELKTDLAMLREDLPRQYVIRDDHREDMRDIKSMLAKIFDKLDGKQDK